jgi:hypothetical protein
LANTYRKTGEALALQGKSVDALREFRQSLVIWETLGKIDLKNSEWLSDEALAYFRVGMSLSRTSSTSDSETRSMLTRARDTWRQLKEHSTLSAIDQSRLEQVEAALKNL